MINIYITDSTKSRVIRNSVIQQLNGNCEIELSKADPYSYMGDYKINPIFISPIAGSYITSVQIKLGSSWEEILNTTDTIIDISKYVFVFPVKLVIQCTGDIIIYIPIKELNL